MLVQRSIRSSRQRGEAAQPQVVIFAAPAFEGFIVAVHPLIMRRQIPMLLPYSFGFVGRASTDKPPLQIELMNKLLFFLRNPGQKIPLANCRFVDFCRSGLIDPHKVPGHYHALSPALNEWQRGRGAKCNRHPKATDMAHGWLPLLRCGNGPIEMLSADGW